MKKLILLKLGGSLITDKFKPLKFMKKRVLYVIDQISQIDLKRVKIIMGTGAGSYGHYFAQKYKVTQPIKTINQHFGVSVTHDSVVFLNHQIIELLLKKRIHAFSIHPASFMIANKKEVVTSFIEPILLGLNKDFIPVLFGDMIFDITYGSVVISTEKIFSTLAPQLIQSGYNSITIVHVGITNGIIDSNGKTIPVIQKDLFSNIESQIYKSDSIDVTGGMALKLKEAIKLTTQGIRTVIVNGINKYDLTQVLQGKSIPTATIIE